MPPHAASLPPPCGIHKIPWAIFATPCGIFTRPKKQKIKIGPLRDVKYFGDMISKMYLWIYFMAYNRTKYIVAKNQLAAISTSWKTAFFWIVRHVRLLYPRASNGCICSDTCGVCICLLIQNPTFSCECWKSMSFENMENFKEVVQGLAGNDLSDFFQNLNISQLGLLIFS